MKKILVLLACALFLLASCESREERMMREMREGMQQLFGENGEAFGAEMEDAFKELGDALEDIDMEALENDLEDAFKELGDALEDMDLDLE